MAHWIIAFPAIALLLVAAPQAKATLYDDMGGKEGIDRLVDNSIKSFLADPRIGKTFDDTNMVRFRTMLTAQFCHIADGPCKYNGHSMAVAHRGLALRQVDFNALAEDLQSAMDVSGIPFRTQNRLLALLAPMQRDVVTK
jgi:hemoglobin